MTDEPEFPPESELPDVPMEGGSLPYPEKGVRIGEYMLGDALGQGAMATVFLAEDATGHEVAIKLFQEGPGVSKTMLERFRREAEASKKLRRHTNIITIYSTGRDGPFHYIVMESVKNSRTLEDMLESTPSTIDAIVGIIIKIARALHYAHTRGIVHRDVKPTNVLVDEFGEPLLTDFGVAALIDWPSCTLTGALTGTPLYMSPEQARTEKVGPASDIYSLGVVLYEALTGVLPYPGYRGGAVKKVLEAVINEPPRRPRVFRKEISPDLEAVILKALEKRPKDRYLDAESFATDLERAVAGKPVAARRFNPFDRVQYYLRKHGAVIGAALGVILLAVGLRFYFVMKLRDAHFEGLIRLAQLKNATYRLQEGGDSALTVSSPAWHELRRARKAMTTRNWTEAGNRYRSAAQMSEAEGDLRTVAIAKLEAARCASLMGDSREARDLYRAVMSNPDAPPIAADMAQIEAFSVALLQGDRSGAYELLIEREPGSVGPLRDAVMCLGGEISAKALAAKIPTMPHKFHNDLYFYAAVRHYLDGDIDESTSALWQSVRSSSPASEWPSALAKQWYAELKR